MSLNEVLDSTKALPIRVRVGLCVSVILVLVANVNPEQLPEHFRNPAAYGTLACRAFAAMLAIGVLFYGFAAYPTVLLTTRDRKILWVLFLAEVRGHKLHGAKPISGVANVRSDELKVVLFKLANLKRSASVAD